MEVPVVENNQMIANKEVKLQIPLRHHVNLQSLKVLTSQSIRDTVVKALDQYFRINPVADVHAAFARPA